MLRTGERRRAEKHFGEFRFLPIARLLHFPGVENLAYRRMVDYRPHMTENKGVRAEWSKKAEDLRPLLAGEFYGLNDSSVARELNRRGIPSLNGGRWKDNSVSRLRKKLGITARRKLTLRIYRGLRENLSDHFGGPMTTENSRLLDATAWAATATYRAEQIFNLAPDLSTVTAEIFREYKRQRELLGALLGALRIASDVFEKRNPPEHPRQSKSRATAIYEDVEIFARVEAELSPRIATADGERK